MLLAGNATLLALAVTVVDDLLGNPLSSGPAKVWFLTLALVPIAVLATFVRRRLARGSVAGLVVQLGGPAESADLRAALARALGDPSLELAYWFPAEARYVDRRRAPDAGARRRQRQALDVRAARRHADRDAAARLGARAQLGSRAVSVRRRGARARERAAPGGAPRAAGRAQRLPWAAGRGHRLRAPPDRAKPPRWDTAAARLDRDVARSARVEVAPRSGRCGADRAGGAHRARAGARGATRADPGHPSDAAGRARASGGAGGALPARRAARAPQRRPRRPAPRPGRDRRLLLRERGAQQRRQAFARERGQGRGRLRRAHADRRDRRRRNRRRFCRRVGGLRFRTARPGRSRRGARGPVHGVESAWARHTAEGEIPCA